MIFNKFNKDNALVKSDVYMDNDYLYSYIIKPDVPDLPLIMFHSAIEFSEAELVFINKAIVGLNQAFPEYGSDDLIVLLDELGDILINDVEQLITKHLKDLQAISPSQLIGIVTGTEEPNPKELMDNIIDDTSLTDKTKVVKQLKQSYKDTTPDSETGVPNGLLNELNDILNK